jgi:hypothetical protein
MLNTPSSKVDSESQRPEGLKVVVHLRPPQYLDDFKLYPGLKSATKSTVIRSRPYSKENNVSQLGPQRSPGGCPVSLKPTPPVQDVSFQSSSTHDYVFGLRAPYTQHQAECTSACTPTLTVKPRTTRSGRHHVVETIESSNISPALAYKSNTRQHRRPGKRKRPQSPTSAKASSRPSWAVYEAAASVADRTRRITGRCAD